MFLAISSVCFLTSNVPTNMHACIRIRVCVHVFNMQYAFCCLGLLFYTGTYIHTYIPSYLCINVHMYICTCVCSNVSTCMHTYICIMYSNVWVFKPKAGFSLTIYSWFVFSCALLSFERQDFKNMLLFKHGWVLGGGC